MWLNHQVLLNPQTSQKDQNLNRIEQMMDVPLLDQTQVEIHTSHLATRTDQIAPHNQLKEM